MIEITYQTEGIPKRYAKAISEAKDKEELIAAIEEFGDLAEDALDFVKENDYKDMAKAIKKGLLVPGKMLKVAITAERFSVPFGTAYIRLKESGAF